MKYIKFNTAKTKFCNVIIFEIAGKYNYLSNKPLLTGFNGSKLISNLIYCVKDIFDDMLQFTGINK